MVGSVEMWQKQYQYPIFDQCLYGQLNQTLPWKWSTVFSCLKQALRLESIQKNGPFAPILVSSASQNHLSLDELSRTDNTALSKSTFRLLGRAGWIGGNGAKTTSISIPNIRSMFVWTAQPKLTPWVRSLLLHLQSGVDCYVLGAKGLLFC